MTEKGRKMNIPPVNFGKKYISRANAVSVSDNKKIQMDFVEYEKTGSDLLKIIQTSELWEEKYGEPDTYIGSIAMDFYETVKRNEINTNKRFFGLEDKKGRVQAICETRDYDGVVKVYDNIKKPVTLITYFCTNPKSMHKKEQREYSKLGTSLFASLLKHFKTQNPKEIRLCDSSRGFWNTIPNMKFTQADSVKMGYLPKSKQRETIRALDKKI